MLGKYSRNREKKSLSSYQGLSFNITKDVSLRNSIVRNTQNKCINILKQFFQLHIPAQVRLRLRNIGGGWKGMGGYVGPVLTGEDLDQVAKAEG